MTKDDLMNTISQGVDLSIMGNRDLMVNTVPTVKGDVCSVHLEEKCSWDCSCHSYQDVYKSSDDSDENRDTEIAETKATKKPVELDTLKDPSESMQNVEDTEIYERNRREAENNQTRQTESNFNESDFY